MKYWNDTIETMDRNEIKRVQNVRLKETLLRVYNNVPYYRKRMDQANISVEGINTIEDLYKLPFTLKTDLRDNYPYNHFAVPMKDIVRIHASSGTTGKPITVGYTKKDIDIWADIVARALCSGGVDENSIIQISYGYGLFTGGLGMHYGAEKLGASVIPASSGNTQKQLMIMKDLGATVIACTPSYALHLADTMKEFGISKDDLKLKYGIFGAEPWSESLRNDLETKYDIKAIDIFGLSEAIGPGVGCECLYQNGIHIFEDHFIPEIIDPETLEVLPEGSIGELVLTSLTKEAFPIIRYRTRDITSLTYEKCKCGRTHARINRLLGRSDDMLVIRGVNVFPSQIEHILLNHGQTESHYLIIVDKNGPLDTLEIQIELPESIYYNELEKLNTEKSLSKDILSVLGISAKITAVKPETIERSNGKAIRVIDRRKR